MNYPIRLIKVNLARFLQDKKRTTKEGKTKYIN